MAKLYIMCGPAFSGKTTLSKLIAQKTSAKRFAFDEIWVEKEETGTDLGGTEGWKHVREAALDEILETLRSGVSAVYDENNPKREHRKEFADAARRAGFQSVVVFMDIPLETIRSRRLANLTSQERHDVDDKNFDKVLNDLERPGDDEDALTFTPDTELEEFVNKL